jgi:glycosyltransferase involved in cell wall biosynthesis
VNNISFKILIPILGFGRSGGMRVLSQLANCWKALGHDVSMVCFFESEEPYYPTCAKIIWVDKNGITVNTNNSVFKTSNLGIKRVYAVYKYLKKNFAKYDIILANQNQTAWTAWLGSKSMNIYYIQAYEPELYTGRNIKAVFQKLFAWATYILPIQKIVNSDLYKNYRNLKAKHVIPPGLDMNIYYPKELPIHGNSDLIIGCIGRKENWKGSDDVAQAVKILHEKGYKIKFEVAFNPVNYDGHILVIPNGDADLANFYRSLDVLVAPGHLQLGAVHYPVIEAMACKTTVITTGYYPANVENSYIVPIKDPEKIAEAILDIIKNPDLARIKSEKAYNDIQQFDWNTVSKKFINIFQELKNDKTRKG